MLLCPAKWRMERLYGIQEERSEIAERGTAIHLAIETGKGDALSADDLSEARRLAATENEAIQRWLEELGAERVERTVREQRLWLSLNGKRVFSGKPDAIHIIGKFALLVDYKTGFKKATAAEGNVQLACNAVLAAKEFGVTNIRAVLVQAKFDADSVDYDEAALIYWENTIRKMVRDMDSEDSKPNAGQSQCAYCKAFARCEAVKNEVGSLFATPQSQWVSTVPSSRELDMYSMAEKIISERRRMARMALQDGQTIAGWELGNPRKTVKITDPTSAYEKVADIVSAPQFAACCDVSIVKLSDAYANAKNAKVGYISKKAARAEVEEMLAEVIDAKVGEAPLKRKGVA